MPRPGKLAEEEDIPKKFGDMEGEDNQLEQKRAAARGLGQPDCQSFDDVTGRAQGDQVGDEGRHSRP